MQPTFDLRMKVRGTNKRPKNQIYLSFSEYRVTSGKPKERVESIVRKIVAEFSIQYHFLCNILLLNLLHV